MSEEKTDRDERTGDQRIWEEKLAEARTALDKGNVARARKILRLIEKDSTDPEAKKKAAEIAKTLSVDPWFYILWGVSAAVLLAVFIYYVIIL